MPQHIRHQFYRTETNAYNRDGNGFLRYTAISDLVFEQNGRVLELPLDNHPIDAQYDVNELSTMNRYELQLSPQPSSTRIDSITEVDALNMSSEVHQFSKSGPGSQIGA